MMMQKENVMVGLAAQEDKKEICLKTIEDMKEFVSICDNYVHTYPCEIDLVRGRYIIDATSIMGVIDMCSGENVSVMIHTDYNEIRDKFFDDIRKFIVE